VTLESLLLRLKEATKEAQLLLNCGWSEADVGMAVFAQCVVKMANASAVEGVPSDTEALLTCAKKVKKAFPDFSVKNRKTI
jgi:hypothetical protein